MLYSRSNPSQAYLDGVAACIKTHQNRKSFRGQHVFACFNLVYKLFKRHNVKTVIDYGCGRCEQHEAIPRTLPDGHVVTSLGEGLGVTFVCYDPAVPQYATLPTEPCDAVIVSDVLEYIPKPDVPWVLAEIFRLATRCVFLSTSVVKPRKVHAEYERPVAWWLTALELVMKTSSVDWLLRLQTSPDDLHLYRRGVFDNVEHVRQIVGIERRDDPQLGDLPCGLV